MEEYREVKQRVIQTVKENVEGPEDAVAEIAEKIADAAMEAIADNYRSITEVHCIVEAVRAGARMQIEYVDPDEDDFEDPCDVRACW